MTSYFVWKISWLRRIMYRHLMLYIFFPYRYVFNLFISCTIEAPTENSVWLKRQVWCSDWATSMAFRAQMRECEAAKMRKRRSDTTIASSPSKLRTFAFNFFYYIQPVSVDSIECDAGTVPAQGLPINLRWYACGIGHRVYYECLLIFFFVYMWHIRLPVFTMPNHYIYSS